jgi:glycosyltransferase involved in cell wall biosynthesis
MEVAPVVDEVASRHYDDAIPSCSVVVSTRDRGHMLPDLLGALERQHGAPPFEVVVVDDGSTDATWDQLKAYAEHTPLALLACRLASSVGQGPGRNTGIARARGEIVAFTDDDCRPGPDWLARLTAPLLGQSKPAAVVSQGRTVPPPGEHGAGSWDRTVWVLRPTWLFETCNIAYRRADLQAVGGFPGRAHAPVGAGGKLVGEDALLGWRVMEAGADLVFVPDAEVHHVRHPGSYRQWLTGHWGRTVFPELVRRHGSARRALWARWFLSRRTAAFDMATMGVLLAGSTRRPAWLLLVAPWARLALREAADRGGDPAIRLLQVGAGDAVGAAALVAGSIRSRRLVL